MLEYKRKIKFKEEYIIIITEPYQESTGNKTANQYYLKGVWWKPHINYQQIECSSMFEKTDTSVSTDINIRNERMVQHLVYLCK